MNNNQIAVSINRLPRLVRLICSNSGAWLVGSSADPANPDPKDYDIAVSFKSWGEVALLIPKDARPTLYGGWKFVSDSKEVDMWPDEIINIFLCSKCEWMWQPQFNIRISKIRDGKEA